MEFWTHLKPMAIESATMRETSCLVSLRTTSNSRDSSVFSLTTSFSFSCFSISKVNVLVSFNTFLKIVLVNDLIRYDTIEKFNVDSKAEYSALSSTRMRKKYIKEVTKTNKRQCPFKSVGPQVQIREGSQEENKIDYGERICERDEF